MMARRTMTTAFCGAFWGLAATAGLAPDFGETTVQSVPAGETAPAATLTFGDRPSFYKTGGRPRRRSRCRRGHGICAVLSSGWRVG